MIDVVGELRIEIANGSFDNAAKWTTASKPSRSALVRSRRSLRISGISWCFPELATCKQICIEANHFVAGGLEHWPSNRADVSFMSGQKYFHVTPAKYEEKEQCCLITIKKRPKARGIYNGETLSMI